MIAHPQLSTRFVLQARLGMQYFLVDMHRLRSRTWTRLNDTMTRYGGQLFPAEDDGNHAKWLFDQRAYLDVLAPPRPNDFEKLSEWTCQLRNDVLDPSSIPANTLMRHATDCGALDIHHIDISPLDSRIVSLLPRDLVSELKQHLHHVDGDQERIPGFRVHRFLCEVGDYTDLANSMLFYKYFGARPILLGADHLWLPNESEYGESVWQHADEESLSMLEELKQDEDVYAVWHNLRHVYPWRTDGSFEALTVDVPSETDSLDQVKLHV